MSNVAPVPTNVCAVPMLLYVAELTAVPAVESVSISPPVSTVLTVIVRSLAGDVPPSTAPETVIVSFSAYPEPI